MGATHINTSALNGLNVKEAFLTCARSIASSFSSNTLRNKWKLEPSFELLSYEKLLPPFWQKYKKKSIKQEKG